MAGTESGGAGAASSEPPSSVASSTIDYVAPHWSRHLKCHVCYGYLQQPHTLNCGHSFCRSCLVQLGRTAKLSSPDLPVRYLRLACPTCRAIFPASCVLRGHASTTFLIQNILSEWKKERKRLQSTSTVTLRSICTQTPTPRPHVRLRRRRSDDRNQEGDMHEEFHVRLKLDDIYFRSSMAASSDSSEEADIKVTQPEIALSDPVLNASETSTVSSSSSGNGNAWIGHRFFLWGRPRRPMADERLDWSPGRVLLISIWCMYSMVVVGIAQPMLPYMVLFTLFFLLVILK